MRVRSNVHTTVMRVEVKLEILSADERVAYYWTE